MIYYLTNTLPESVPANEQKNISPAARNKAAYIELCMEREKIVHKHIYLGNRSKFGFYATSVKKVSSYTHEICLKTVGGNFNNGLWGKCVKKVAYINSKRIAKKFLQTLTEKDTLIAYHTLLFADVIASEKKKRKFRLILELEELYQDLCQVNNKEQSKEWAVIDAADAYILSTDCLTRCIEPGKPYLTINGTYQAESRCKDAEFKDSKIHCVYAGILSPSKGSHDAIKLAAYLPEDYHVHILGYGTADEVNAIKELIAVTNPKCKCTLTYDGLLSGKEYIEFLQKCQIGLCTQDSNSGYIKTAFPSKVLVYMANGLHVISSRFEAIEGSSVGNLVHYYDEQTPEMMASAVMSIDFNQPYDPQGYLKMLDDDCRLKLKKLISNS